MPIRIPPLPGLVAAAKAFADPNRVRILSALRAGELCVCELCDGLDLTQSTLSTHLQVIRAAGLVGVRKQGKWSYYAFTAAGRRLADSLWRVFAGSLAADARLRADGRRLGERLKLREAGACCVGFGCAVKPAAGRKGRGRT